MADRFERDEGVVTRTRSDEKLARPHMYRVLLHNDDFTTREFVVDVLRSVFHKKEQDAELIMLNVHNQGAGVAGVYTREIAETKIRVVEQLAKAAEFPLRLTMEPED